MKICKHCGETIPASAYGNRKFCSSSNLLNAAEYLYQNMSLQDLIREATSC